MADQADVETALAAIAANALYPSGLASASITGGVCRVYRGFPNAPALDADLAGGVLNVSITAGAELKNVTRYQRIWQAVAPVAATLTVLTGPQSASFAGTCAVGQLAGVAVNGALFPYAVQGNDTPPTVASNLAAALRLAGWLVDYAGATIAVPAAREFTARVVYGAGSLQEIKRQIQDFSITIWAPDPATRDTAAANIDIALASLNFMPLVDGSSGRLVFSGRETTDESSDATLYKSVLKYDVEYPTTLSQTTPAMLFGTGSFNANAAFDVTI